MENSDKLIASLKEINEMAKELKKVEIALEMRIHKENIWHK